MTTHTRRYSDEASTVSPSDRYHGRGSTQAKSTGDTSLAKVVDFEQIKVIATAARREGLRVVLCHGVFDLFHVGHLRHLAAAKRHGDVLVVSLTADDYVNKGPDRPVFPAELRAELMAALGLVDWVIVAHSPSAEPSIEAVQPAFYVKGSEYADPAKDITGKIVHERELVERHGGQLVFTQDATYSSSTLLNGHFNLLDRPALSYLETMRASGGEAIIDGAFAKIEKLKVLVIGETILDRYKYVAPMGKAPKENIIATLQQDEELFAGGVIAATNHLASLTPNVELITILGDPQAGENHEKFVRQHLAPTVKPTIIYRPDGPTIEKTRFVEPTYVRKLFEVYNMDDRPLPSTAKAAMHKVLKEKIAAADLVVVFDFGHGFIDNETIRLLERAKFLAINTQSNAGNTGYNLITRYHRADFVCIDAMEARLAARDKHVDLERIVGEIIPAMVNCPRIIVTHGKAGCFTSGDDHGTVVHVPAFRRDVIDSVGAGDAFFAMAAPFVAVGVGCPIAGFIGNAAGAIKVGIVGHRRTLSKLELQRYVTTLLK